MAHFVARRGTVRKVTRIMKFSLINKGKERDVIKSFSGYTYVKTQGSTSIELILFLVSEISFRDIIAAKIQR